jgi:1-deoxy-D-xylulose-5-phosphate synthase
MYLEKINSPADVKKLNSEQRLALAQEMRDALLKKLSIHGGHFGPNFGMVEATIALHYVFDSPVDKLVFDVSHQSYCHKMLTGRKDAFLYEEKYDDVSGYSNPDESEHDFFTIGHTSTSISLACGLAKARDLNGEKGNIIAIIGDGSLSGGEALEALDFASELKSNLIILVNDNDMSIAENHGGLYENLRALRESNGECECNLFKAMNLDYKYVAEGNDIDKLISAFESVKDSDKPVVLHICTQKGKGYALAEQNKENWHWCMPFDAKTGKSKFDFSDYEDYSAITVNYLLDKMQEDKSVVAITSATPAVFGFTKENRDKAGKQFVDVGIAEEHAVALASGIAKNGGKPVYGVYSTFLQRTYDQLSQDVCINNSAVTFLVFSASVYGMNDVTHLGIYDIPMISNIPNMVYLAPTSKEEYLAMTKWAIDQTDHPVAIRVPSNGVISSNRSVRSDYSELNRFEMVEKGGKVAVVALGDFYQLGEQVAEKIKSELSIDATLINPIFATGIDEEMLDSLKADHEVVVTLEDGMIDGGFGEKIARYYGNSDVKVLSFGLKKEFPDRYDLAEYLKENKLTPEQIVAEIKALV